VYSTLDDHIVQKKMLFVDLTALYYGTKLLELTKANLVSSINRRIGYSGEENSRSGKYAVYIFSILNLGLLPSNMIINR